MLKENSSSYWMKHFKRGFSFQGFATVIVFIVIFVLLSIISPYFLTMGNMMALLRQISMMLIAGVGSTFLIITGNIDLSIGSVIAVTGVTCALLVSKANFPVPVAILAAILLGGFIGTINSLLVTELFLPSLLATLGMMGVLRGIAFLVTGGHTVRGLPESYIWLGRGWILGHIPVSVFLSVLIFVVFLFIQRKTKFGLYTYAIGGNRIAASLAGINVRACMNLTFIINGLLAGIAGVIASSRIGAALPNAGVGFEMDVITGVVIGGTSIFGGIGKLEGTLLGVLIIGMITNGMYLLEIHSYWQQVAKGIILIIALGAETIKQRRKD